MVGHRHHFGFLQGVIYTLYHIRLEIKSKVLYGSTCQILLMKHMWKDDQEKKPNQSPHGSNKLKTNGPIKPV